MVKSYRCFTDVLLVLKLFWFSTEVAFGAEVLLIVSAFWIFGYWCRPSGNCLDSHSDPDVP